MESLDPVMGSPDLAQEAPTTRPWQWMREVEGSSREEKKERGNGKEPCRRCPCTSTGFRLDAQAVVGRGRTVVMKPGRRRVASERSDAGASRTGVSRIWLFSRAFLTKDGR